jgi:hypothetical protein
MPDSVELPVSVETAPYAVLPRGRRIAPTFIGEGFHGTSLYCPEKVLLDGIPAKGNDLRLYEHALGNPESAFRGSTALPSISPQGQGAVYWAGIGGWVYQLENVPMWALEKELQGQVITPTGFGDCPNIGEVEQATPARIEQKSIVNIFVVEAGPVRGGQQMLRAKLWKPTP